jgi:uncharacterized protein YceK
MDRILLATFALLCAVACSGCGTFSDMICGPGGGSPFYRGVQMDVGGIRQGVPFAPLLAADLPFSAVADTAMVPYIAYKREKRKQEQATRSTP